MCGVSREEGWYVSKGMLRSPLKKHPCETVKAQKRASVCVAVVVAGELAKRERADMWAVEELSKRQCHLHSQELRGVCEHPWGVHGVCSCRLGQRFPFCDGAPRSCSDLACFP